MRKNIPPALPALLLLVGAPAADAQMMHRGDEIRIERATGPVVIDGVLDDAMWEKAQRVERWYEFNPGDNIEPSVRSVGYLAFDDRFLYAALDFSDPDPGAIRAPLTDRDRLFSNATDFGGIFLDTRNDGHSAFEFFVTAAGVQYDAVTDDGGSGEDSSPDFFWDSAARITERGWSAEIRVPFSSLRYRDVNPQTWGVVLYRNYPRDFRFQIATTRIPRGSNCTVCLINNLVGLEGLPRSQHVVVAPYVSSTTIARPANGLGSGLDDRATTPDAGLDLKWIPNADTSVDFTVNPDFSQVEADTAQITANELFALSFPEKRPFFLEGVELLSTPIRAVYTRAITNPRWGARSTGKAGGFSYTTLVTDDSGGGSVLLPGPTASSSMAQDFQSYVLIARAKRDIGRSFVSVLAVGREGSDGVRHNRVAGPDFQWRRGLSVVTGQLLFSDTRDPGRARAFSHGGDIEWRRETAHLELNARYKDAGDDFRADTGFVTQVGFREPSARVGWTMRPDGLVRRVRMFANTSRQVDRDGGLVSRTVTPTFEMDIPWGGLVNLRLTEQRIRNQERLFDRRLLRLLTRISPSQTVQEVSVELIGGRDADFANARPADGLTVNVSATVNPTRRLSLGVVQNTRRLNVDDATGASRRLLVAGVSRLRANYMFTANSFVRVIGQYTSTTRDPLLFRSTVARRVGAFSGSALFAYKLNWQSVLFVGYGDDRELTSGHELRPSSRQFFTKVSYAFQR